MISKLTFGYKKPTEQYVLRPSCYAIILTQPLQRLLLSKRRTLFLPGGGMEGTETKDECLHRELLEELGWIIEIEQYIGNAMRYFYAKRKIHII